MTEQLRLPRMPPEQCQARPPDRARIDDGDGYIAERRCMYQAGHHGPHRYSWHEIDNYITVVSELVK